MSYDLTFLPCPPELHGPDAAAWFESWEPPDDEVDLDAAHLAAWQRIVDAAAAVLAEREQPHEQSFGEHAELDWPDLGILLEFWPDEVTISAQAWHEGEDAGTVAAAIHRLAGIVETHTGLRGYDTVLGAPVTECAVADVVAEYRRMVSAARRPARERQSRES